MKNYELLSYETIDDINSEVRTFRHKSGAEVIALKNDDDNKVFSICFKTPVDTSNGVPHILEHAVLNGSRKYPTKEPFMQLIKTSLNTFLNAITFPDRTIYPVASRNEKDFHHLMDVYLDSVFFPRFYKEENIFLQEGWHYQIENPEDPLNISGVVFNEMKGAYSNPDQVVYQEFQKAIFPDTNYAFSSGGDPYEIPKLSYEELLDFHQKYYHPSNSLVFLYGNGDLEKELTHIDEFLSEFKKEDFNVKTLSQKTFEETRIIEKEYSLSPEDDPTNKDYLLYGLKAGETTDIKDSVTADILSHALFNSEASRVKRALLDLEIADDIMSFDLNGRDLALGVLAKNTDKKHEKVFISTIEKALKEDIEKGIDKDLLEGIINRIEFQYRETFDEETAGIIYSFFAAQAWVHDADPALFFRYEDILGEMRELLKTDYFEMKTEEFLNTPHKVHLTLKATPGLNEKKDLQMKKELEEIKKSLSFEDLEKLIEKNKNLIEYQSTEDTKEDLEKLPKISLTDLTGKIEKIPREIIEKDDYKFLINEINTNGIIYYDLLFDISHLKEEELFYLSLISELLGDLNTEHKTYQELTKDLQKYTGRFNFQPGVYPQENNRMKFKRTLNCRVRVLPHYFNKSLELFEEILTTSFKNSERIFELLKSKLVQFEQIIVTNGHQIGLLAAGATVDPVQSYRNKISGFDFYQNLKDLVKNFKENEQETIEHLEKVFEKLFHKNNLLIHVTTDEDHLTKVKEQFENFASKLKTIKAEQHEIIFKKKTENIGISTPSNVNYVNRVLNFPENYQYKGSDTVLASFLSLEYLYGEIRVKGGAYGMGMTMNRRGLTSLHSYRDPHLKRTLETYNNIPKYLEDIKLSDEDIESLVIGTYNQFDPPLTPCRKGQIDLIHYMTGMSHENLESYLCEAMNTKLEDFKERIPLLKDSLASSPICVIGKSEDIKENKEIFTKITEL